MRGEEGVETARGQGGRAEKVKGLEVARAGYRINVM